MSVRLRYFTQLNPSKSEAGDLSKIGNATFAPMEAIADGLGGLDTSLEKSAAELASGSYSYFAEGDILLAKVTPCFENGKKALVSKLTNGIGFATSEVHVIRPLTDKIHPNFLRYLLSCETFRAAGIASMTGAGGLKRVSENAIRDFPVQITNCETQRTIADFLDCETARIDQLVAKKQALVDRLPEKEKAKISALVLRGADGGAPLRDSGLEWRGQVPAHWDESRLKAHFRPAKRQGYDDLEVLSVYREFGVIEKASRDDNINKTPDDLSKYQLVEPGDLVINKMKAWQGSLGISTFRGITSPDYVVMTRTGDHHPRYMHHLLRAQPMPTVYHLISNGIRTDQWRLEPEKFRMLPVFLPPRPEQEAIAGLVEKELLKLREVSEVILQSIDRLREYRAALITAAVTGQIDVSDHTRKGDTDQRLDAVEAEMRA